MKNKKSIKCNNYSVADVMKLMNIMREKGRSRFRLKNTDDNDYTRNTLEMFGCTFKIVDSNVWACFPKNFKEFTKNQIWNQCRLEKMNLA